MYKYDERKTERVDNSMMHVDKVSVTFLLDYKNLNRFISYFKTSSSYGWVFFFLQIPTPNCQVL